MVTASCCRPETQQCLSFGVVLHTRVTGQLYIVRATFVEANCQPFTFGWFKGNVEMCTHNSNLSPHGGGSKTILWCVFVELQWRHYGQDGVSNHQPHDCLLNRLFRHRSKKTPKLRVIGHCEGDSPVTGEFLAQRASNAENVFIWWRHHGIIRFYLIARLFNEQMHASLEITSVHCDLRSEIIENDWSIEEPSHLDRFLFRFITGPGRHEFQRPAVHMETVGTDVTVTSTSCKI